MQMTFIEKNILSAVHDLPIDKQQEIYCSAMRSLW
jgi:hypothetical protein